MAEQAYAGDLKSSARKGVPVRIREGLLTFLALLTASACGGVAKSDGPGGDSGSVSADDFPARYAGALCALTERCCNASGGTQLDACQRMEEEKYGLDAARARRSGARFDVETAELCLADLENRSCQEDALNLLAGSLPDCRRVWRGQAGLGEACEVKLDCLAQGDESVSCIDGECGVLEWLFLGSECDPRSTTVLCPAGFSRCDAGSMTCLALPAEGESCTGDCQVGHICQEGVCQLEAGLAGSDCTAANECQNGQCAGGRCASMLVGSYCAFPE